MVAETESFFLTMVGGKIEYQKPGKIFPISLLPQSSEITGLAIIAVTTFSLVLGIGLVLRKMKKRK